jgi:HK97 family phage major capsid protein
VLAHRDWRLHTSHKQDKEVFKMTSSKVLLENRSKVSDEIKRLRRLSNDPNHEWTSDNGKDFNKAMREFDALDSELRMNPGYNPDRKSLLTDFDGSERNSATSSQWRDSDGNPVHVLSRGDSVADLVAKNDPQATPGLSLGRLVRSLITGDKKHAQPEWDYLRATDLGGTLGSGGVIVPTAISANVIDLARADSFVFQAGAKTVAMTTADMRIAKITSDPTIETKKQSSSFAQSDITFGGVTLTAKTLGTYVKIGRELVEDAPNINQIVDDVLRKALAAEIEKLVLQGQAGEPTGLLNDSTINETGSIGAISWEDMHAPVVTCWNANESPNAYVVNPTIAGDLELITTGDGSTSAKNWLGAPKGLADLLALKTTSMPLANAIIGDFTKLIIGLRQNALVEITKEGVNAFEKHQVGVKITWRGDFAIERSAAFERLAGITS